MKISTGKPKYKKIKIVLETKKEADSFMSLIDKVDMRRCNANMPPMVSENEYELVKQISNFFTDIVGFMEY